jgi:hypothetical protein
MWQETGRPGKTARLLKVQTHKKRDGNTRTKILWEDEQVLKSRVIFLSSSKRPLLALR